MQDMLKSITTLLVYRRQAVTILPRYYPDSDVRCALTGLARLGPVAQHRHGFR